MECYGQLPMQFDDLPINGMFHFAPRSECGRSLGHPTWSVQVCSSLASKHENHRYGWVSQAYDGWAGYETHIPTFDSQSKQRTAVSSSHFHFATPAQRGTTVIRSSGLLRAWWDPRVVPWFPPPPGRRRILAPFLWGASSIPFFCVWIKTSEKERERERGVYIYMNAHICHYIYNIIQFVHVFAMTVFDYRGCSTRKSASRPHQAILLTIFESEAFEDLMLARIKSLKFSQIWV